MNQDLFPVVGWGAVALLVLIALIARRKVLRLFGLFIVPEDSVAIITKKFVLFGAHKTLPDGRIIALNGEAGFQADTLAPGLHWWLWPWQYEVTTSRFLTIPEGRVGVVDAADGAPLTERVFGKEVECDAFQNARAFLMRGGERGPQLSIIPPGTYRVNTSLF